MADWYSLKEQGAGKLRLRFLWYVYRIFGLTCLKYLLTVIVFFIALFAPAARKASREYIALLREYERIHGLPLSSFSPYRHILSYAWSLTDKMSVMCDRKPSLHFETDKNDNLYQFMNFLNENTGVFLLCSHLGNIDAMAALPAFFPSYPKKKLHALMQISQNSIFYQFIKSVAKENLYELHPAEEMDFAGIMTLYESLEKGDLLMMAGDRVSAQNPDEILVSTILGKKCFLPKGAFTFAKKMKHPVFAVFLLETSFNSYKLYLHRIKNTENVSLMADEYAAVVEKHLLQKPLQWYNFYSFFR